MYTYILKFVVCCLFAKFFVHRSVCVCVCSVCLLFLFRAGLLGPRSAPPGTPGAPERHNSNNNTIQYYNII